MASKTRPKVLFVSQRPTSFIEEDLAILRGHYDVRVFGFGSESAQGGKMAPAALAFEFIRQRRWLLRELPEADLVYGWFADYHLALPVRMSRKAGKPVAVVLGGFDANVVPELDYGVYGSRWRAPLARYVIRNASLLLPVADALIYHENRYAAFPDVLPNGVAAHVPRLHTPYVTLPTGYDLDKWPMGALERSPSICSVAYLDLHRSVRIKGIDLLIEAARQLGDVPFDIIGVTPAYEQAFRARFDPPPNVRLHPPFRREDLAVVYAQSAIYAQLSRSEGMPNVVAEAMACGCIPVCSAVAGIPLLVGDTGPLVEEPDVGAIVEAIRVALAFPASYRLDARARIAEHFSLSDRRTRLHGVVDSLIGGDMPSGWQMAVSAPRPHEAAPETALHGSQSR